MKTRRGYVIVDAVYGQLPPMLFLEVQDVKEVLGVILGGNKKLLVPVPMTGKYTEFGADLINAARIAIEEKNARARCQRKEVGTGDGR